MYTTERSEFDGQTQAYERGWQPTCAATSVLRDAARLTGKDPGAQSA